METVSRRSQCERFGRARFLRTRAMTNTEAVAPAKYQGAMNSGAHEEYSDEPSPTQTGAQYRTNATPRGAVRPRPHAAAADRQRTHANANKADTTATTAAPDERDSDVNAPSMARALSILAHRESYGTEPSAAERGCCPEWPVGTAIFGNPSAQGMWQDRPTLMTRADGGATL